MLLVVAVVVFAVIVVNAKVGIGALGLERVGGKRSGVGHGCLQSEWTISVTRALAMRRPLDNAGALLAAAENL